MASLALRERLAAAQSPKTLAGPVALRCTGKLLKTLGVPANSVPTLDPSGDDWYANLVWFDRRKCLVITHTGTLFSVFVADVRKSEVVPFAPFVRRAIEIALTSEGLPLDALGSIGDGDLVLTKTASRQVLGCMTDLAYSIQVHLAQQGGLAAADLNAVNFELRRTINMVNEGRYPIELARDRVGRRTG